MIPRIHSGILDDEIPLGGLGRTLTPGERSKLASAGVHCGERHIVVRVAVNTSMLGRLYEPVYTAERHAPMAILVS